MRKTAIWFLSVIGLAVIAVGAVFWHLSAPTSGAAIDPSASATALLVIDVQEDYTGRDAKKPFRDAERLVKSVNRLIRAAAENGWDVVFIRNEVPDAWIYRTFAPGLSIRGTPGARVDARLDRSSAPPEFSKSRGDAYSNPEFDQYLRERRVRRVLVAGLDGAYCVKSTTGGARKRGYETIVIQDAIATESGSTFAELADAYRGMGASVQTMDELLGPREAGAVRSE